MPYFVAFLNKVDPKKDKELLEIHIDYLNKHIELGNIYAKGPFMDHSGGLIIYKASDYDTAYKLASEDPAVKEGSRELIFKEWKSTLVE